MNEYIIIFHDKSTKWITKEQAMGLSKAMDNPDLFNKHQNIGESKIALSSIAKILSEREYKEQYPETGQIFKNQFKKLPEVIDYQYESIDQQATRTKKGHHQLLDGLQRYIEENPNRCKNAKELLKEKKIKFGLAEKI